MKAEVLVMSGVIAGMSAVASAAYINNGNFEAAGTSGNYADFADWYETNNPGSVMNPGIEGKSLLLSAASNGTVLQAVTGNLSKYVVEMKVAVSAPSVSSARVFNVFLRHGTGTDQINLRIMDNVTKNESGAIVNGGNGLGDISVANSAGVWTTIAADCITFSPDQANLKVNTIKFVVDYAAGDYDVMVTNAAGQMATAADTAIFQLTSTTISASTTLQQILFGTGNWAAGAWSVVDDVKVSEPAAIPEPAAVSILVLGGGMLLGCRRRSK